MGWNFILFYNNYYHRIIQTIHTSVFIHYNSDSESKVLNNSKENKVLIFLFI